MPVDANNPEVDETEGLEETENPLDSETEEEPEDPSASEIEELRQANKGLSERLERMEERSRTLEETNRLLERAFPDKSRTEEDIPSEFAEIDKILSPVVGGRIKKEITPLVESIARIYDETDAVQFDNYLSRNHPEVLDDEDLYAKTVQQIDVLRRQNEANGKYVKRQTAFEYLQGVNLLKEQRSKRKTSPKADAAERRRVAEVGAAKKESTTPERRVPTKSARVESIAAKARSGERLTAEERAAWREDLASRGAF